MYERRGRDGEPGEYVPGERVVGDGPSIAHGGGDQAGERQRVGIALAGADPEARGDPEQPRADERPPGAGPMRQVLQEPAEQTEPDGGAHGAETLHRDDEPIGVAIGLKEPRQPGEEQMMRIESR